MATHLRVTYRDIAKMLAKALPIEGADFGTQVEENIAAIEAMPEPQRTALKIAYVFSCKVPSDEKADFFQELALTLLEAKVDDDRLAYTIARADWKDFWSRFKTREHYLNGSLNRTILDAEGHSVEWGDLLAGVTEYERLDSEIDGKALIHKLPEWVQSLLAPKITVLYQGKKGCEHRYQMKDGVGRCECGRRVKFPSGVIRGGDRMMLNKWVRANPWVLVR